MYIIRTYTCFAWDKHSIIVNLNKVKKKTLVWLILIINDMAIPGNEIQKTIHKT